MTTIQLERIIPAAPAAIYDLVTRPARWHEWHPSSIRADASALESLVAGARFEEDIRSAGFIRHLRWQVTDAESARYWAASAVMDDGSTVALQYRLQVDPAGTRFVRTLDYRLAPPLLRLLNAIGLWRRVQRESNRALDNLVRRFSQA